MRKRFVIAAAVAAAMSSAAMADLTVDQNLGSLAPGAFPFAGTTVGASNGADNYAPITNPAAIWDQDFVYQFTVNQSVVASVTTNDPNGAVIDNDFFLLSSLSTTPNINGLNTATTIQDNLVEVSGSFGVIQPGTYYMSVDAFRGVPGGTTPATGRAGAYAGTLSLAAIVAPASTPAFLGGSTNRPLAAGQVAWYSFNYNGSGPLTFDTEGSTLSGTNDTELGLFDSSGSLVVSDDDSGTGNLSLITIPGGTLPGGTYYLAVGAFNTVFGDGFQVSSTSTQSGNVIINGLSVPEPTSLALLGLAGAAVLRRRR